MRLRRKGAFCGPNPRCLFHTGIHGRRRSEGLCQQWPGQCPDSAQTVPGTVPGSARPMISEVLWNCI